jgi:protease-4
MTDAPASFDPAASSDRGCCEKPERRSSAWRVVTAVFLALSVAANIVLVVIVLGLAAALVGGMEENSYVEKVVQKGPATVKIAIIRMEGIIDQDLVESVGRQIRQAADDPDVKAVILRIDSPGGGLSESDMLHHEIKSQLAAAGKPVVAAMDGLAASGGYYVACAADTIVAQQTTITGSIGIIAHFFFLNTLMTDKLGITPVTLKMGEQKDWPNLFAAEMTPEQSDYLMNTLLKPGYDRFVDVVAAARKMDRPQVLRLATGRVFMAEEAKQNGLVDEIGYLDRAIEIAKMRAGAKEARVVEYAKPFFLTDLLGVSSDAKALLSLNAEKLAALASPKVMYLWTGF